MCRKERVIIDWIAALTAYFLVLAVIPVSSSFLVYYGAETVNTALNLIINFLILSVFLSLLIYLLKRGRESRLSSYFWLAFSFAVCNYFLLKVEVTAERLHFLGYGILSLLLYRALRHNIGTKILYALSAFFIMLFAIIDEALQLPGWGGRSFEFQDIGIDWLSGLMSQVIIFLVVRPKLETIEIKIGKYVKGLKKAQDFETIREMRPRQVNFDRLAEQVCLFFRNITGDNSGHVHFIYKGKSQQLILVCSGQRLEKIVAKDKRCKEGKCLRWDCSEFSRFSPREAFLRFLPQVRAILIECPHARKSWGSFREFQDWLNKSAKDPAIFS